MADHRPRIDISHLDPVDVVLFMTRKAGLDMPDGASDWLSATGPAPDDRQTRTYRQLLADLRAADLPDYATAAIDDALDGARGDNRLADLLGQATGSPAPDVPDADTLRTAARAGVARSDVADVEHNVPQDAQTADPARNEPPDAGDDPIGVLLSAARGSGVPVPAGAHAWLSQPGSAPFGESWPYRRLLTSLALAPLTAQDRRAVDDALAQARSGTNRIADMLGPGAAEEPSAASEPPPSLRRAATGTPSRGLRQRDRRQTEGDRRRADRRRAWLQRLGIAALLSMLGAAGAWGASETIDALRSRTDARLNSSRAVAVEPDPENRPGPDVSAEASDLVAAALDTRTGAGEGTPVTISNVALPTRDPALHDGSLAWSLVAHAEGVTRTLVDADNRQAATVTTVPVTELFIDHRWRPADGVAEQLQTAPGSQWAFDGSRAVDPPAGRSFYLTATSGDIAVAQHQGGRIRLDGQDSIQRWFAVPTTDGVIAVVLELATPRPTSSAVQAATAQWLSDSAVVLSRIAGVDRDDVITWVADVLAADQPAARSDTAPTADRTFLGVLTRRY
jgi:hypothetical protein